jgi:hypothetical protein
MTCCICQETDLSKSPVIDDQQDSSNGIESEKGEILQTGYTALPLEDDDGECDSENADSQNISECCEDGNMINSVKDCTTNNQRTACLSDQDVQQIKSAMRRLHVF